MLHSFILTSSFTHQNVIITVGNTSERTIGQSGAHLWRSRTESSTNADGQDSARDRNRAFPRALLTERVRFSQKFGNLILKFIFRLRDREIGIGKRPLHPATLVSWYSIFCQWYRNPTVPSRFHRFYVVRLLHHRLVEQRKTRSTLPSSVKRSVMVVMVGDRTRTVSLIFQCPRHQSWASRQTCQRCRVSRTARRSTRVVRSA